MCVYLCVLGQFKVSPADVCEDPAGVVVVSGDGRQDVDGILAVIATQSLVASP